jgi:proteasome accessory factor B
MAQARLERLMNVVAYLSDTRVPRTAREIVTSIPGYPENVASARRSFERDKQELRSMNFDIAVVDNPDGDSGYIIHKETTYFDAELTAAQRSIVQYALALYGPEKDITTGALTKLGGLNPEAEIDSVTSLPVPEILDDLYSACASPNIAEIIFRGQTRIIAPYRLIARSGYWYLEADDIDKNESRTFRVDRIEKVTLTNDAKPERKEIAIKADDERHVVRVRVHPSVKVSFQATWNAKEVAENILEFSVPRLELIENHIYEYSGFIAVLEPQDLADSIHQCFSAVAQSLEAS